MGSYESIEEQSANSEDGYWNENGEGTMTIEDMEPMEPNRDGTPINPFRQDLMRMGTYLGTNVAVMYFNHDNVPCSEFVIVDMITGERKLVKFENAGNKDEHIPFGTVVSLPEVVADPNQSDK